jgi:hypothetical protein
MNKFTIALSIFVATTYAQTSVADETTPSPDCLYCRRMDANSGFLVSYSYCK